MAKPTYVSAKRLVQVDMHLIIDIVKEFDRIGLADELRDYLQQNGAIASLGSKHVNIIKKFLFDRKLHETNRVAKNIVSPVETGRMATNRLVSVSTAGVPSPVSLSTNDPDCCTYRRR